MRIKKSSDMIFGVDLTTSERKAMVKEIRRQIAEQNRNNSIDVDSIILWVLHDIFGFGKKRLKNFYDAFTIRYNDLIKYYEMDETDGPWLCREKLKEIGIDIKEWNKRNG